MILHGISHDVCHLVESTVVERLHRVEYATLHRLQAVVDMRHGTLQNHIRSVIEKPVAEHTAKAQARGLGADGGRQRLNRLFLDFLGIHIDIVVGRQCAVLLHSVVGRGVAISMGCGIGRSDIVRLPGVIGSLGRGVVSLIVIDRIIRHC